MTIAANLVLTEVLSIFKERIENLLTFESLEKFDGDQLAAVEAEIRQFGVEVIGHCIALLLHTLNIHPEATASAHTATEHGRGFGSQSQGKKPFNVTTVGNVCVELLMTYVLTRPRRQKPDKRRKKRRPGQRGLAKGQGFYPFARWLALEEGVTPMVWSMAAESGLMSSSFAAANHPLKAWGIQLSDQRLERLTYRFTQVGMALTVEDMQRVTAGTLPVGDTFRGQRVVLQVDGGRARLRFNNRGSRRKSGRHGYAAPWREPKLFTLFAIDEQGRRLKSLEFPIFNDGSFGELEDFLTLLKTYLVQAGVKQAQEVLLICDGATWMWKRIPALLKGIGVEANKIHELIDFYHAADHLQDFADLTSTDTAEASQWFRAVRSKLRHNSIAAVLKAMKARLIALPPDPQPAAQKTLDFFDQQPERFQHAHLKKLNWPIGSGAIESLIRQVVNLRVKGNGKFWLPQNAELMIHGRCQWVAGQWKSFVQRVLTAGINKQLSPDFYTKLKADL